MNNNLIQSNSEFTSDIINHIIEDQIARRKITCESHMWFFHLYFSPYVKHPTAIFQKELFAISEDESIKKAVIVAFRGSAKSTIMTMSYPIWAVLGKLQKKCVVILSQTQQQAKTHFANIKRELESNELLRRDLGPFEEESDEWGSYALVIPQFNARIVAASSEQSIRGIRHGANRPDLIICDDVEDLNSTKTREGRDKTYGWFTGEIVPCGDKNTKIIVIGNLLHEDSLLMRLKKRIEAREIDGIFRSYPMVDTDGNILWSGKFPTMEDIEKFRRAIGDDISWQREFMLRIIADVDQIIQREWIQFYDNLPDKKDYRYSCTAVDLAISESASADFTAIVSAHVYGYADTLRVYILPNPINKRLDFPTTLTTVKQVVDSIGLNSSKADLCIESVGYQEALVQQLRKDHYYAKSIKVNGDKRARLSLVSPLLRDAKVLFPRNTADVLIQQLLYFGKELHDDQVDAFTMLMQNVIKRDHSVPVLYSRWELGI